MMDIHQIESIKMLRSQGCSYGTIAKQLNLSINTVKSFCQRSGLGNPSNLQRKELSVGRCKYCEQELKLVSGKKKKLFCSDKCRNKWWNSHLDLVNRKAYYPFTCKYCKTPFEAYGNRCRKYCSKNCYYLDRFGCDRYGKFSTNKQ